MSYCRWGPDSDVYVYPAGHGNRDLIVCCGCALRGDDDDDVAETPQQMIAHLDRHVAAGHKVPEAAFERLRREAGLLIGRGTPEEDEPW